MRTITRLVAVSAVFLIAPALAHAQAEVPANPLYRSISGANAEPVIFYDVSLSSHQLLTAAIQFQKEQDRQKVLFSPFKLSEDYIPFWSEMQLNFAQEGSVSTFGLGLGWTNAATAGARATRIWKGITIPAEPVFEGTPEEIARKRQEFYDRFLVPAYNEFYQRLAKNSIQVTVGANVQRFGFGGDKVDADEDGKIDNQFDLKGYDLSAGLLYTASQSFGLTGSYHRTRKRASGVEGQELVDYDGFSFSTGYRVAVLNPNYASTADYLKSLFVPSVVLGLSYELQECTAEQLGFCEKNLKTQTALSPFVDFKITPQTQFKISFPILRRTLIGKKSQSELAPIVAFSVQLSGGK